MQLLAGDKLPTAVPKRGALRSLGRKKLTGLDRAHPLQPLHHDIRAPSGVDTGSMAPAPPEQSGKSQSKPKRMKARRCVRAVQAVPDQNSDGDGQAAAQDMGCVQEPLSVTEEVSLTDLHGNRVLKHGRGSAASSFSPVDLRTPSALRNLPFLNTPTPPIASAVPAPPETAKPQAACQRQFISRLPRFKRTPLSVATAVAEQKSVESLAGKEEVRDQKEVKKRVITVKQMSNTQQTSELPELAKLAPVSCPEQAILQAFRLLKDEDWEQKIEGLTSIRSLSQHHAEVLLPRLHDVCLAVYREVKNLRSMVSRAAMITLAHLYAQLGRGMDAEAEGTAQTLLPKAGEASGFIREDMELALGYMVHNVTPSRTMNALINTGLRHRNAAVRKTAAQHLERLAEVMGASRVLSGKKDLTDRFVRSISCLALDSAQEVRTHARNTFAFLASHTDLLKMVDKFVPQRDRATIKDVINKCQKKKH
ncbi:TOG array regulator of axonemal microtubules protein 1-like [Sardina pilchardus]|uniref:TOG array regulator of axonemal microtubules protein 1-like n=1 Tax=Sardina pilchardus TaxID=27697 RepID=UPI002E15DF85